MLYPNNIIQNKDNLNDILYNLLVSIAISRVRQGILTRKFSFSISVRSKKACACSVLS
jgi:hypothetical protein